MSPCGSRIRASNTLSAAQAFCLPVPDSREGRPCANASESEFRRPTWLACIGLEHGPRQNTANLVVRKVHSFCISCGEHQCHYPGDGRRCHACAGLPMSQHEGARMSRKHILARGGDCRLLLVRTPRVPCGTCAGRFRHRQIGFVRVIGAHNNRLTSACDRAECASIVDSV